MFVCLFCFCLFVCFSVVFCCCFLNPATEVVTLRLRGWCMLGVFLLLAFTRLGHVSQDLWSPCDGMHVCTDQTSVYILIRKSFGGNGVRTHINTKGKMPSTGKKSPQRRMEPTTLHQAGQRAQHTTNELFRSSVDNQIRHWRV